jgi:simple sugar transport system ATP-binding protein
MLFWGRTGQAKVPWLSASWVSTLPLLAKVLIDKQVRTIDSPRDAHKYGIGMVYQHFTSVPAMTVAENLVLSRFDSPNLINWKEEYKQLNAFMQTAPFQVPLDIPIAQLAAGQKQKLEILKQIYLKVRILILDEPTSVLTPQEADEVLGLLRSEVQAGRLSVLIISHKFREVMAFCDEITVLRKGKFAGHGLVKELTVSDMSEMMMGEKREPKQVEKAALPTTTPVLEVKGIHANKDNGLEAVSGVNLTVHNGEIVGIAGISGNGQRELVEVLGRVSVLLRRGRCWSMGKFIPQRAHRCISTVSSRYRKNRYAMPVWRT